MQASRETAQWRMEQGREAGSPIKCSTDRCKDHQSRGVSWEQGQDSLTPSQGDGRNQGHTCPPAQSDFYRVESVHVHQTRCCSALSPPSLYPTALSKRGLFRMPVTLNQIHHACGIFLSYSCSEGGLPPRVSGPIIQATALCGPQRRMHARLGSWSISVLLSFHTSVAEHDRSPSQLLIRSRLSSVRQALRRQAGLHDLPAPESHSLSVPCPHSGRCIQKGKGYF